MINIIQYYRQQAISTCIYYIVIKTKQSSLFNNAFYLMLNNIVISLLGFIFWNIMARSFSPEQVGIGSALVAISGFIGVLSNLGLGIGLIRFIPEVKDRSVRLINSSMTISGGFAVVGSLIYLSGVEYWSPALDFVSKNYLLSFLFIVFTALTVLSTITDQSLVAGRSARYVFLKNTCNNLLKIPLTVFVFAFLGGFGIFVGTGVGFLVANLLTWFYFLPSIYKGYFPQLAYEHDLICKMLPYSFANYLAFLLNRVPRFIYPIMVINVLGPEKNAYFYITWMMTMMLAVIPSGLAQSLLAEGAHDQSKLSNNGWRALIVSLLLSIPAAGGMILLGGWFLQFFGSGYAEYGTRVIRYLSLAVIPLCINMLYITVNQVKKRVHLIIVQTAVLTIISLGLGYLLLGKIGLDGIGIAYLISHLVVATGVIRPLWKSLQKLS